MFIPWAITLAIVAGCVGAYLTIEPVHREIRHAIDVLRTGDQDQIRDYLKGYGAWAPAISFAIMVLQVLLVAVPTSIIMFANGIMFGIWWGTLLNLAGRTIAGMLGFGIARALGKRTVERLVGSIADEDAYAAWIARHGGWAVFATRAVPGMPSDMLSFVIGVTSVGWRTFTIASLLGYLPQCFVYAWLGSVAAGAFLWIWIGGWILAAVIGLVVALYQWRRRRSRFLENSWKCASRWVSGLR